MNHSDAVSHASMTMLKNNDATGNKLQYFELIDACISPCHPHQQGNIVKVVIRNVLLLLMFHCIIVKLASKKSSIGKSDFKVHITQGSFISC